MAEEKRKPKAFRKRPFHRIIVHENKATIVYLTLCTNKRVKWLATNENHQLLKYIWTQKARAWFTGKYIIMPDYIHLFASLGEQEICFDNWVKYWKSQFRKARGISYQCLQTDYWDTQVRGFDDYEKKWEYVKNNPVRHGYVSDPDDWPFQGEIFHLSWY